LFVSDYRQGSLALGLAEGINMFDAEYFNAHVMDQITRLGSGSCSLEVHLNNGVVFRVRSVDAATAGYVLLEVYPEEGVNKKSMKARRKPGGTDEIFYDRVAVAYSSISYVFLTVKESEGQGELGFGPATST
jgi:hypothetical protein